MAARNANLSCLKPVIRSTPRALAKAPRPLLASRPFHASQWVSSQPAIAAITPGPKTVKPVVKSPTSESSMIKRMSKGLRELMPGTTEQYVAYGITQELYNECVGQAEYTEGMELSESARFWYEVCKREPTFTSWAQVTILHMWMLVVRIRAFDPGNVQTWQQHFVDHFFYDSEGKMIKTYKLTSGQQRKTYLKDLFSQYRGMIAGFDEGLIKGDAVLSAAIWRNVFDADPDTDVELLALITSYIRRVISGLDKVGDDAIYAGKIRFGLPMDEEPYVAHKSKYLERVMKKSDVVCGEMNQG